MKSNNVLNSTFSTEVPKDYRGYRELARAVLLEAFICAENYEPGHRIWSECMSSRRFLLGEGREWNQSLAFWSEVADIEKTSIIRSCKKKEWYKDHLEKREFEKQRRLIVLRDESIRSYKPPRWTILKDYTSLQGKEYKQGETIREDDRLILDELVENQVIQLPKRKGRK